MMATSEHEPRPGSVFFAGVGAVRPLVAWNARWQSQNVRRTFVLAQSVGWFWLPPG